MKQTELDLLPEGFTELTQENWPTFEVEAFAYQRLKGGSVQRRAIVRLDPAGISVYSRGMKKAERISRKNALSRATYRVANAAFEKPRGLLH